MNIFTSEKSLEIAVATTNAGKLEGITEVVNSLAEQNKVEVNFNNFSVDSGVSDTPLSDEEGILGCENRLAAIEEVCPDASLYIAVEGVLSQVRDRWFVRGWSLVKHPLSNRQSFASGSSVEVPATVTPYINPDSQISSVIGQAYELQEDEMRVVRELGINGLFSDGVYPRSRSFYDGIGIAVSYIQNDRNW